MPKILKYILKVFLLAVFTVTVFRWLVLFFLTASSYPLLFLIQAIKTNLRYLTFDIYTTKFPLVYMNPQFRQHYKTLRISFILLANFLSFLFFLLILPKITPKKFTKHLSKLRSVWLNFKKPKYAKRLRIAFLITIFLFLLSWPFLILPTSKIYSAAKNIVALPMEINILLRNQNFAEAEKKLKLVKEEVKIIQQNLERLSWVKFIPLLKDYYRDGASIIVAGNYAIDSGLIAVDIMPNLRLESLEETEKFIPQIGEILNNFSLAKEQIDKINPNRYPERIKDKVVKEKIVLVKNKIEELEKIRQAFQPLLKTLPEFIGGQKPKRFLVLFQEDNGLQPNGGRLTAYGVFRLEKGKIIPESSGNIWRPIKADVPPNFLFPRTKFEGTLMIDSEFFVNLFKVLGPTIVYDKVLSAEINPDCDCPTIISDIQQLPQNRKKEIIGIFLNAALVKSFSSPLKTQFEVLLAVLKSAQEKHLLIHLADPEQQKAIEFLLK